MFISDLSIMSGAERSVRSAWLGPARFFSIADSDSFLAALKVSKFLDESPFGIRSTWPSILQHPNVTILNSSMNDKGFVGSGRLIAHDSVWLLFYHQTWSAILLVQPTNIGTHGKSQR